MDVVALLEVQAINTKRTLARHVIDYFAGVYRVIEYPSDPTKSPVIIKRYTSAEKAEEYLLSLCPRPAATRVQA